MQGAEIGVRTRYLNGRDLAPGVPFDMPQQYFFDIIAEARAQGANVENWIRARVADGLGGPVAEALHTHTILWDVLCSPNCIDDLHAAGRLMNQAGLSDDASMEFLFEVGNAVAHWFSDWRRGAR